MISQTQTQTRRNHLTAQPNPGSQARAPGTTAVQQEPPDHRLLCTAYPRFPSSTSGYFRPTGAGDSPWYDDLSLGLSHTHVTSPMILVRVASGPSCVRQPRLLSRVLQLNTRVNTICPSRTCSRDHNPPSHLHPESVHLIVCNCSQRSIATPWTTSMTRHMGERETTSRP
jgi:hypothetical protein